MKQEGNTKMCCIRRDSIATVHHPHVLSILLLHQTWTWQSAVFIYEKTSIIQSIRHLSYISILFTDHSDLRGQQCPTTREWSNSLQGERAAQHGGDEHHGAEHGDLASRVIHPPSIQRQHRPVRLHHPLATSKLKLWERSELWRHEGETQETVSTGDGYFDFFGL